VSLVLNSRGNVVSVALAEFSGDPAFDDAAISMIRRSDPDPPPPGLQTISSISAPGTEFHQLERSGAG
jgi:TonB family protein